MPVEDSKADKRCDQPSGSWRGLTQPECVAYARLHPQMAYLGSQTESGEFGGCVVWERRSIEFNGFRGGVGCNVGAKGGVCLCTPAEPVG